MANFTNPVKEAFGRFLQEFHAQVIPDTKALAEYTARDFSKAAVWAPGRMIDQVLEMLDSWRKNDTSQQARATPFLPIIIAAMAKEFTPAAPDFGRPAVDAVDVTIPDDPKQRYFKMRTVFADIRTQVAICAPEEPTARSLAMQLNLWCQAVANRRFYAHFPLVGVDTLWPVVFEIPEIISVAVPNDQKNLTVLAADFNLRATIPMLMFPKPGDLDADGQGAGTYEDPDGYLTVQAGDLYFWGDVRPDPDDIPPGIEPDIRYVGEFE